MKAKLKHIIFPGTLLIFILLIAISSFVFTACNNDSGPTIVNNGTNSNNPPDKPNNPTPADSLLNASNIVNLMWHGSDPDAGDSVKYDVYFSNVYPPITMVANNTPFTSYGYGVVDHNATFYWKVVAKDLKGATTSSPVWRFTTAPPEEAKP